MEQGINVFIEDSYMSRQKILWVTEFVGMKCFNIHFDGEMIVRTELVDELASAKSLGLKPLLMLPDRLALIVFKEIVESMSRNGVKTKNQLTLEGELKAKQEHLEDMQLITKKLLKIK